MKTVADRLSQALAMRGLSKKDLADKTGISPSSITRYVQGTLIPKTNQVSRMAEILNVNPLWLACIDDDEEPIKLSQKDLDRSEIERYLSKMDADQMSDTLEFIRKFIMKEKK